MVGYNPEEEPVPWFVISMAGGTSGILTRAVTQPLDVIKIRLQVQDTHWSHSKYHGTFHSLRTVMADEGVAALWKGHAPAQVLSLTYGLVQFTGFDLLTHLTHPIISLSPLLQPLQDFICGSLAGVLATLISYPFDVARTRYIIQGYPPVYRSMRQTIRIIIMKESVRGLYRGLVPTVVQIAPNMGFQFAFYHLSSHLWDRTFHTHTPLTGHEPSTRTSLKPGHDDDPPPIPPTTTTTPPTTTTTPPIPPTTTITPLIPPTTTTNKSINNNTQIPTTNSKSSTNSTQNSNPFPTTEPPTEHNTITQHRTHPSVAKSLICGSFAGFGAKTLVYPLDFTKKRLQAEGVHSYSSTVVGKAQNYTGFIHCMVTVVRREGVLALYKGFVPSSLKAIVTSSLIFASYEYFKRIFADVHKSVA